MSAVAVAFAAAWTRPERRTAALPCSASAQSDQPVAAVAPAGSTPARMSRSEADRLFFPPVESTSSELVHAPIGMSVTIGCRAWPSHAPLSTSLGAPSEISPRTLRLAARPEQSSASTDSSRSARAFNGEFVTLQSYPRLSCPTRSWGWRSWSWHRTR